MPITRATSALAALVLLLALSACSSGSGSSGGGDASAGSDDTAASASADDGAGDDDAAAGSGVCALVPAAELSAAVGTDPGAGADGEERGLANCTWTVDDSPAVLAQTGDAATYFPTDLYPQPDGANAISGVDTGWASAEQRTVFIVKNGVGLMLNDFLFGTEPGDQDAWDALGAAVAANM